MSDQRPSCFGDLDTVFPLRADGLRASPTECLCCVHKTPCLKTAMQGRASVALKREKLDRAYSAGLIGFLERWSRRKALSNLDKKK